MGDVIYVEEWIDTKIDRCKECISFRNLNPYSRLENEWNYYLCAAKPFHTKMDPCDLEIKPYDIDSRGREYFVDHPLPYCYKVNRNCYKFYPKLIELASR